MIILKTDAQIEIMRKAGKIVAETLEMIGDKVKPGITTAEIDRAAEEFILSRGPSRPSRDIVDSRPRLVFRSTRKWSMVFRGTGCLSKDRSFPSIWDALSMDFMVIRRRPFQWVRFPRKKETYRGYQTFFRSRPFPCQGWK